jgi:hypothetical protein
MVILNRREFASDILKTLGRPGEVIERCEDEEH